MLRGDSKRMEFAAQLWQSHKDLDIWVCDCDSNLNYNRRIFQRFGVPNRQLRFDGRATDTVTNFTSMVDKFAARKLQHIYLIDYIGLSYQQDNSSEALLQAVRYYCPW